MMKNNGLLKWTLHKNKNGTSGKNWQHAPEALTTGHIAYLVKFLGVTDAEHPKGIDVVKDCIRKLKLDEEIRRAEGLKTPKAEVTISVDGVAIQEPKGKKILHQFPLHQISYCADDKAEKKYFTFIAKEGETHKCFVFASEKLAEEITLTIGQAFDLAYKRFLESSGRELELKKEIQALQKRVAELEGENSDLKQKIQTKAETNSTASTSSMSDTLDLFMSPAPLPTIPARDTTPANVANQLIAEFTMTANEIEKRAGKDTNGLLQLEDLEVQSVLPSNGTSPAALPAPPPRICPPPPKGKKVETPTSNGLGSLNGLNLTPSTPIVTPMSMSNGNGFNSSGSSSTGSSSPGSSTADIFGSDPFFTAPDPFGMTNFNGSDTSGGSSPKAPMVTSSTLDFHQAINNNNNSSATNGVTNGFSSMAMMNSTIFNSTVTSNGFSNNNNNNPSSPFAALDSAKDLFNTENMNMLNQFSFQQQAPEPVAKPANIDSALRFLDKNIEEMKIGFIQKS